MPDHRGTLHPMSPPPQSRNPDTILLFALCLMAGTAQVASGTEPGTIEALVPSWMALTWGLALIIGAALVLTGVLWRQEMSGLLIELVGRATFGPSALAYAVAIYASADEPVSASLAAAPFVAFSAACLVRTWQIVHRAEQSLQWMRERRRL